MPEMKVYDGSKWVVCDAKNGDTVDGIHFRVNGNVIQYSTDGSTWKNAGAIGTANPAQVLSGYTFSSASGVNQSGTMTNRGAWNGTITLTSSTSGTVTIPSGFHSGSGKVTATVSDADLIASNIRSGKNILGVTGTLIEATGNANTSDVLSGKTFSKAGSAGLTGTMPNQGAKIITPSTVNQAIPAGYHNGSGYVKGDSNLIASNIKKGVTIFGVTGTLEYSQTASGSITLNPGVASATISLSFTPKLVYVFEKKARQLFIYSSTQSLLYRDNYGENYYYGIGYIEVGSTRCYSSSNIITNGFRIILRSYSTSEPSIVEWFAVG